MVFGWHRSLSPQGKDPSGVFSYMRFPWQRSQTSLWLAGKVISKMKSWWPQSQKLSQNESTLHGSNQQSLLILH